VTDMDAVVAEALRMSTKDPQALALEIGLRAEKIEQDPAAGADPALAVAAGTHMGLVDDAKALGWRVLMRWNKSAYGLVCPKAAGATDADAAKLRQNLLHALSLDEAALIAAAVPLLIWLGAPAAIAAAAAPLLVKQFIVPAKEELCDAWGEALQAT
jgi:hypothetical protein